MRTGNWLDGFAAGLLTSTIFACLFFWARGAEATSRFDDYFIALLTAAAALAAAVIAVWGIRAQIDHAAGVESERRDASRHSAKAMLPLALAELYEASLSNIRRHFDPNDIISDAPPVDDLTPFSLEALGTLRSCIEYADPRSRDELAYIIRAYQILAARDASYRGARKIAPDRELGNLGGYGRLADAVDWASLHASISLAFEYARGIQDTIVPFDPSLVWGSFLQAGLSEGDFPSVETLVDKRTAAGRIRLTFAPS